MLKYFNGAVRISMETEFLYKGFSIGSCCAVLCLLVCRYFYRAAVKYVQKNFPAEKILYSLKSPVILQVLVYIIPSAVITEHILQAETALKSLPDAVYYISFAAAASALLSLIYCFSIFKVITDKRIIIKPVFECFKYKIINIPFCAVKDVYSITSEIWLELKNNKKLKAGAVSSKKKRENIISYIKNASENNTDNESIIGLDSGQEKNIFMKILYILLCIAAAVCITLTGCRLYKRPVPFRGYIYHYNNIYKNADAKPDYLFMERGIKQWLL